MRRINMKKVYQYVYDSNNKENLFKYVDKCIDNAVNRYKKPVYNLEYRLRLNESSFTATITIVINGEVQ